MAKKWGRIAWLVLGVGGLGCQQVDLVGTVPNAPSPSPEPRRFEYPTRVDLVVAVSGAPGRDDLRAPLLEAIDDLLQELRHPDCVDAANVVVGPSQLDAEGVAQCAVGSWPTHPAISDIHLAWVTPGLGAIDLPGVSCLRQGRVRVAEGDAIDATTLEEWWADVPDPECLWSSPLESVYRFLVAPDPWQRLTQVEGRAVLEGIDDEVLRQRAEFLRHDSQVMVVLASDRDDAALDPLAVGGSGWLFGVPRLEGDVGLPRGTRACSEEGPGSPDCTSCAYQHDAAGCELGALGWDGREQPLSVTYTAADDPPALRFFDMKLRYGVDPTYPVQRYTNGFIRPTVPSRDAEHGGAGQYGGYNVEAGDCVNPLFARNLPRSSAEEWCKLDRGGRSSRLVTLVSLVGAPNELFDEPDWSRYGQLTSESWTKLGGTDPMQYNRDGIDARMLPSHRPREGRPEPGYPDVEGLDPDNQTFRDWDTLDRDLQFACTFALDEKIQVPAESDPLGALCAPDSDAPLCSDPEEERARHRVRGRAYPGTRQLMVTKQLGSQGVVGSSCPRPLVPGEPAGSSGYLRSAAVVRKKLAAWLGAPCGSPHRTLESAPACDEDAGAY